MGVSLAASYKGSLAYFRAPQVRVDAAGDVGLAEAIMQRAARAWHPGDTRRPPEGRSSTWTTAPWCPWSISPARSEEPLPAGPALVLVPRAWRSMCASGGPSARRSMAARAAGPLRGQQRPQPPAHPRGARGLRPARPPQFDRAIADTFAAGDWDGSPHHRSRPGVGRRGMRLPLAGRALGSGRGLRGGGRRGPTTGCCRTKGPGAWATWWARWS